MVWDVEKLSEAGIERMTDAMYDSEVFSAPSGDGVASGTDWLIVFTMEAF